MKIKFSFFRLKHREKPRKSRWMYCKIGELDYLRQAVLSSPPPLIEYFESFSNSDIISRWLKNLRWNHRESNFKVIFILTAQMKWVNRARWNEWITTYFIQDFDWRKVLSVEPTIENQIRERRTSRYSVQNRLISCTALCTNLEHKTGGRRWV